jgi:hypothetical protein
VEVWVHYTNRGDREPLASPIGIGRRVRRRQTGGGLALGLHLKRAQPYLGGVEGIESVERESGKEVVAAHSRDEKVAPRAELLPMWMC